MNCDVKFFLMVLLACTVGTLVLSCSGEKTTDTPVSVDALKRISPYIWERLYEKRIYFGHQSVGSNIIDGIASIMKDIPEIRLTIKKTRDAKDIEAGPVFAHCAVGKNTDPGSKMRDFVEILKNGFGNWADIGIFKFCYIDFDRGTDVQKLFDEYRKTFSDLKMSYPNTKFVHVTVPLVSREAGFKDWVKKMLGRSGKDPEGNVRRNEYNRLLIAEYFGKEPIFDLAKVESTLPNGKRETFRKNGKTWYSLAPEYTMDGGHLNEKGRKAAAIQLLLLLSDLAK